MTREQKIEMFAMRLDGFTYQAIADKYGVTRERVRQILSIGRKDGCVIRKNYVYPRIKSWMEANDITQGEIARAIGFSQNSVSSILLGRYHPPMEFICYICEKTGLSPKEAFSKVEGKSNV